MHPLLGIQPEQRCQSIRMGILVNAQCPKVAPCRGQALVAEAGLDLRHLRAGVLQRARKAMSEDMRFARPESILADLLDRPRRQALAARAIGRETHPQWRI